MNVEDLRKELFLHPKITNLNVGSCAVSPRSIQTLASQLREKMAADPVGFIWTELLLKIERSRQALADYLKITPAGLLLMENASFAVNTLLQGLTWQPGAEIIISDQEYPHYFPLWRRIAAEHRLTIKTITLPKAQYVQDATVGDILTAFEAAMTASTTHLFFSHVTAQTGLQLPVNEIVQLAKSKGLTTIIDGAHAPGLVPIDLGTIDPDFYFGNIHKWLMGIPSAGFLYVGGQRTLKPLLTSEHFNYAPEAADEPIFQGGPTHFAANIEYHGTQDRVAQAIIEELLALRAQFTDTWLFERMHSLSEYLYERIAALGFEMVSYQDKAFRTAMVTFRIPPVDMTKARRWFRDQKFEISIKTLGPEMFIRVSTPAFLLESELDNFLKLLREVPWQTLR
jgi:isopenicillin-N epimerase